MLPCCHYKPRLDPRLPGPRRLPLGVCQAWLVGWLVGWLDGMTFDNKKKRKKPVAGVVKRSDVFFWIF